jgi:hypothetical protein
VEQCRGVIPRRIGVVAQTCGCQTIKWLGRVGRCGGDVSAGTLERDGPRSRGALSPRARRTSPEGALSLRARSTSPEGALDPRARRTSPERVLRLVTLVGHGGHQGRDRIVCAFWARGLVFVLRFLRDEAGFPRLFGGPLCLSPTTVKLNIHQELKLHLFATEQWTMP